MLVLSRKVGEKIVIDDKVTIIVNRISGGRVSIGIEAPQGVRVVRSELAAIPDPRNPTLKSPMPVVLGNRLSPLEDMSPSVVPVNAGIRLPR